MNESRNGVPNLTVRPEKEVEVRYADLNLKQFVEEFNRALDLETLLDKYTAQFGQNEFSEFLRENFYDIVSKIGLDSKSEIYRYLHRYALGQSVFKIIRNLKDLITAQSEILESSKQDNPEKDLSYIVAKLNRIVKNGILKEYYFKDLKGFISSDAIALFFGNAGFVTLKKLLTGEEISEKERTDLEKSEVMSHIVQSSEVVDTHVKNQLQNDLRKYKMELIQFTSLLIAIILLAIYISALITDSFVKKIVEDNLQEDNSKEVEPVNLYNFIGELGITFDTGFDLDEEA